MSYQVDARGLSCPEPVVLAKKAVEGTNEKLIEVLVDNIAARENVSRFARSAGCQVEVTTQGEDYLICITRS
ncbi:MAG: sulfurtransferase TusA family protein [bacterium]|jgi:tRNA 2-thiouridine synthesizing protein A